ncbi:MAG: hypothetical protein JWN06_1646 [Propionibacteriaceae bacterium]|jgi:hypothetical protein|nr:hypothetical protein [Propionibacteriaceae bacterium]
MFARMIARDFTRNRSVTVLLVVLMMLSVVLATASAGTLLLGLDNQPITEITPGAVMLHVYYQPEACLKVGDPVRITAADGFAKELTITNSARDSIMNLDLIFASSLTTQPAMHLDGPRLGLARLLERGTHRTALGLSALQAE